MANQWLRLWHDMPTDPKWRTIAKASGQPIPTVLAVYVHLLVDASRNVTRGHASVTPEDLASSLDVSEDSVLSILASMQGRVLQGEALSGWEARQPKREDAGGDFSEAKSAAERKRLQREREKAEAANAVSRQCHDESRNVTLDKEEIKIREEKKEKTKPLATLAPFGVSDALWDDFLKTRKAKKSPMTNSALAGIQREADKAGVTLSQALQTCCERGWASFKADWVKDKSQNEPAWRAEQRERTQIAAPGVAAQPATDFFLEQKHGTANRMGGSDIRQIDADVRPVLPAPLGRH